MQRVRVRKPVPFIVMYNMQGIKHYITSRFPKLGFVKELQWVVSLMKSLQLIKSFTFLMKINQLKTNSLLRKVSSLGGHICNIPVGCTRPILMNGGILKPQKQLNSQLNYICQISNKNLKLITQYMLFLVLK